jgi:hypothetical protein
MFELVQAWIARDGQIGLVAQDGTFLGLIYSDPNHPNSIINPDTYGNPNGNTVFNDNSPYGGLHGLQSPYNSSCLNPPILMDINDKQLALVTCNYSLVDNVLGIMDINFMLGILYGLAYQQSSSLSHQSSDDYAESYRNQYQTSATLMASILNRRPAY